MATATKVIQAIRNFLSGHEIQVIQRYAKGSPVNQYIQSARNQPQPNLPSGAAHKLSDNYYYSRDLRRAAQPPTIVYGHQQKLLEAESKERAKESDFSPKTPGEFWNP